jgi:hypothetical protein
MSLLQIQIDEKLKKSITDRAKKYGVPASSLVKIALVEVFSDETDDEPGNVFNAQRDNNGKGISGKDFLHMIAS